VGHFLWHGVQHKWWDLWEGNHVLGKGMMKEISPTTELIHLPKRKEHLQAVTIQDPYIMALDL
jgi:hypothetical protein